MNRNRRVLTPAKTAELKKQAAALRLRQMQKRWAYLKTGVYWAAGMNRCHESTRVAHVVFRGGALCGAHPHSMGGSFTSAAGAGCRECLNCRKMLDEVRRYANATP